MTTNKTFNPRSFSNIRLETCNEEYTYSYGWDIRDIYLIGPRGYVEKKATSSRSKEGDYSNFEPYRHGDHGEVKWKFGGEFILGCIETKWNDFMDEFRSILVIKSPVNFSKAPQIGYSLVVVSCGSIDFKRGRILEFRKLTEEESELIKKLKEKEGNRK